MAIPSHIQSGALDGSGPYIPPDLSGRTAIVTGGAKGLGEEFVRRLAKAGAHVFIGDIDDVNGNALADELGDSATFHHTDTTSYPSLHALFHHATQQHHPQRPLSIVIANAGIITPTEPLLTHPLSESTTPPNLATLSVNLTGVLYTASLALAHFRDAYTTTTSNPLPPPPTHLILTSSLAAYIPLPHQLSYCIAKSALRGLLGSCSSTSPNSPATTAQHNTCVNLLAPWFVETNILGEPFPTMLKAKGVDNGLAKKEDVGEAVMRVIAQGRMGRGVGVVPRRWLGDGSASAAGVVDLQCDGPEQVAEEGGEVARRVLKRGQEMVDELYAELARLKEGAGKQ